MKRKTKYLKAAVRIVASILALLSFASPALAMSGARGEYVRTCSRPKEEYTLADIAAARLSAYGILEEAFSTPQDKTVSPLSRPEAVELLYNTFADKTVTYTTHPFLDVPEEYENAVSWAYQNKITNGTTEETLGIRDITKPEFITMLLRSLGYAEQLTPGEEEAFAEKIGLSPIYLSPSGFTLGDAAALISTVIEQICKDETNPLYNRFANPNKQLPFPYAIRLSPKSPADAWDQISEAARFLPNKLIFSATEYFGKNAMQELFTDFVSLIADVEKQEYSREYPILPYLHLRPANTYGGYLGQVITVKYNTKAESAQDPEVKHQLSEYFNELCDRQKTGEITSPERRRLYSLEEYRLTNSGDYLVLQIHPYNEAWEMTCDTDPAFTLYEDDTYSRLADEFYNNYVSKAAEESEHAAVMAAKNAIAANVSYDYSWQDSSHSMLGLFINNKLICDGYAAIFQYLMFRAGIPCLEVMGKVTGTAETYKPGEIDHTWSKVCLSGQWYNMDLCWADTGAPTHYDLKSDAFYYANTHYTINYTVGAYAATQNWM